MSHTRNRPRVTFKKKIYTCIINFINNVMEKNIRKNDNINKEVQKKCFVEKKT